MDNLNNKPSVSHIPLSGCTSIPLSDYLKALGTLRILYQKDKKICGYWKDDMFYIKTSLNEAELLKFILEEYTPTPVIAPWNGGSGFSPKDQKEALNKIKNSNTPRLSKYKLVIDRAIKLKEELGIIGKPNEDQKYDLLIECRNNLPDDSIDWLDAAYALTNDGPKYPPLLGTGGNDGRLDFTNNFMQRICEVFDPDNGNPTPESREWLENSLFRKPTNKMVRDIAIGQFNPSASGGINAETGYESKSLVNPWDFILMIEGALFFASSTVKRLQSVDSGVLSYPFTVQASSVGYGSASKYESAKAEIWVPLWNNPASVPELKVLMGEGRSQVGTRIARNGIDFARAIATLGIDRGIEYFERYGFLLRNGKAYFAVPLGKFKVVRNPEAELLTDIDSWLPSFVSKANSDDAPSSISKSLRQLENAIINICRKKGPQYVQEVLISLGECEKAMVRSLTWTNKSYIKPIPLLSYKWIEKAYDGSSEFRLALSLASVYGYKKNKKGINEYYPITSNIVPVKIRPYVEWSKDENNDVVWQEGEVIKALTNVMSKRIVDLISSNSEFYSDKGIINANLGDISDFIEGKINIEKMISLFMGFILIDWNSIDWKSKEIKESIIRIMRIDNNQGIFPDAFYSVLKLCFSGSKIENIPIPITPEIYRLASIGKSNESMKLAIRRLKASNLMPITSPYAISEEKCKRIAASLLFPVNHNDIDKIERKILKTNVNKN
ncbi:MAG: type I-G CRISPR-associated protein Cas8g1/Csx17 [Thermoplasmata archaeon]